MTSLLQLNPKARISAGEVSVSDLLLTTRGGKYFVCFQAAATNSFFSGLKLAANYPDKSLVHSPPYTAAELCDFENCNSEFTEKVYLDTRQYSLAEPLTMRAVQDAFRNGKVPYCHTHLYSSF